MTPNLDRAATAATETLIRHRIASSPISPLPILKSLPGVLVLSFTEMAAEIGIDRDDLIRAYNDQSKDAATLVRQVGGKLRYFVAYNQRLPFYMLQRALARELGHIVLGHDGSRPEDVRTTEALYFARHLLCPRPLIRAIQDTGIPITIEMLGSITGCYERCLIGIQKTGGAHVPPELNKLVREQFTDYVANFVDCQAILTTDDDSMLVTFGTYMDNYEE